MSGTHDVVAPDPQVNFSALDQYIYSLVQNMVDDVELYHAKVDQVKSRFQEQLNALEGGEDQEERDMLESKMATDVDNIPIRSVPYKANKDE